MLSWILLSLLEEVVPITIIVTIVGEIWKALEVAFGHVSQSQILQIKMKFHTYEMQS